MPRLLLLISKLLVKRGLLWLKSLLRLLEASRAPLLLRQASKLQAPKKRLWLKSLLRLLRRRVKPLLQLARRVPILLPKPSKGLLLQLAS
jgi:hypothetical protein